MPEWIGDGRDGLLESLRRLTDDELMVRLKGLAARERRATALLVAHLAELDTRDVYLRAGYSSLFTYCRHVLALTDHEAYNRIEAARTARRFPVVLDLLGAGEVSLTAVRLLAPHLTAENHMAVLESARGKARAEVEEMIARLSPRPDVPALVRKLPERRPAAASSGPVARAELACTAQAPTASAPADWLLQATGASGPPAGAASGSSERVAPVFPAPAGKPEAAVSSPQPRRSAQVKPLSPDRYRYQVTIGRGTLEKLRLAKDMLRHALPSGDDEAILDRALAALLTELVRKRFGLERATRSSGAAASRSGHGQTTPAGADTPSGQVDTPPDQVDTRCGHVDTSSGEFRKEVTSNLPSDRADAADSRHVPMAVKRVVWVRDLGRCAFVAPDGRRCDERAFLEFHHVRPYAAGGAATIANIELRCRRHNAFEARVFFEGDVTGGERRGPGRVASSPASDTAVERAGLVSKRVREIGTSSSNIDRTPDTAGARLLGRPCAGARTAP